MTYRLPFILRMVEYSKLNMLRKPLKIPKLSLEFNVQMELFWLQKKFFYLHYKPKIPILEF